MMTTPGNRRRGSARIILCLLLAATGPAALPAASGFDQEILKGLTYRNIGPYRGGRVTAVTGVASDRNTYYMGSTGGGVWKTTDAGVTWKNVSDGHFGSASVGAVAVAPSDDNVVYAGTGSACIRGNTSPGDGVYRSTDAGKTWTHAGLREAGQIGRIRVHPTDPDLVYVAALGHAFGPNEERGVFRSMNGGETWKKVLFIDERTGVVDLAMNPGNPRILFAAAWTAERKPWTLISGGETSGLHRSRDGGETWEEVTKGIPEGVKGKIGVTVSPANPQRVWALVEAEEGGLFRSEDGGDSFKRINSDRNFRQRAWYYTHVYADTQDENTVYVLNTGLWRSVDGGKEFEFIRAPHGDHHDLWINPDDGEVLINGNDGGANVSFNGGKSWSVQSNQPTAEMYRVTVDRQFPYRVYGCQQDNSCVSLPSRTASSGIARQHWWVIGGCESGHVAVDPRDPEITYAGCYGGTISRQDHATGQEREIMAYPQLAVGQAAKDLRYRFQWNAPIRISPHDPRRLYHTSQVVHLSRDEGQSWEVISPDLSRNDETKQGYAGEPITRDNTGVEVHGTIFAFEESPHQAGLLWAGTDDGRVHVSRDGGGEWKEITPRRMPDWGQVNSLELSAHGAGRAFLAATRYRLDDFRPYIFRTDDFGESWDLLTDGENGIPGNHFVRVVREDPARKGLLYAGTEFGIYVSFDDGESWQSFQQELPVTPITDLAITENDLVVATQGRSFWILDDLTPLHSLTEAIAGADLHLFTPRDTHRFGGGLSFGRGGPAGKNPPGGVIIRYLLGEESAEGEELTLEILDGQDRVVRRLSSVTPEPQAPNPWRRFLGDVGGDGKLPAEKGMNTYVWNFRHHDAEMVQDAVVWGIGRGPMVPPGSYRVRLTLNGETRTAGFRILADPRLGVSGEDLDAQYRLARNVWESLSESHRAWKRIRSIREQVNDLVENLEAAGRGEGLEEAAGPLLEKLAAIEEAIHQMKAESSQDVLNYTPRLDNQLVALRSVIESADARPTDGAVAREAELREELDRLLARLRALEEDDLEGFNRLVEERSGGRVILPSPEEGAGT